MNKIIHVKSKVVENRYIPTTEGISVSREVDRIIRNIVIACCNCLGEISDYQVKRIKEELLLETENEAAMLPLLNAIFKILEEDYNDVC